MQCFDAFFVSQKYARMISKCQREKERGRERARKAILSVGNLTFALATIAPVKLAISDTRE